MRLIEILGHQFDTYAPAASGGERFKLRGRAPLANLRRWIVEFSAEILAVWEEQMRAVAIRQIAEKDSRDAREAVRQSSQ